MSFNSYSFLLAFLPLCMIVFYLVIRKIDNKVLCVYLSFISLIYCFLSGIRTILFLAFSILINYAILLILGKKHSKLITALGIVLNVGALGYFKYYNMFIDVTNALTGSEFHIKELILPLGISFITFQQITILVDEYKDDKRCCSFAEYCAFITFFPHISSGPILTQAQFLPQIRKDFKTVTWDTISDGIYIFAIGLAKKVLLADTLGKAVDAGYADIASLNGISTWYIVIGYTLQIYFDFSGYSDMAVGIAKMFNIELPINFDSPYKARNILEFWDKWHITLTKFFTKYLYIPLGGNRKGYFRTLLNTMIVFVISGLWHGADYTFVIWGFLHGVFMVLTKIFIKPLKKVPDILSTAATFLIVNFLWVFFRAPSLHTALDVFKRLVSPGVVLDSSICAGYSHILGIDIPETFTMIPAWIFMILCLLIVFVPKNVYEYLNNHTKKKSLAIYAIVLLTVCVLSFSGVTTYIYNGF